MPIELAGPGERPARTVARTRWLVQFADPLLGVEPEQALAHEGIDGCAAVPGGGEDRVDAGPADPVDPAGAGAGDHLTLAGEGRPGDRPAAPDLTDALVIGNPGSVEEDLVEIDLAAEVAQRPDLDPGLGELDQEVGQATVLRRARIGAGEEHPELGAMGPGGPHLLPGDPPTVAVRLGARRQRGQVGAGAGLAEQLAPTLLVADQRREEPEPLRPRCRERTAPGRRG